MRSARLLVCAFLGLLLAIPPVASAMPYTGLYVFGDSLSDSGNMSLATRGAIPGGDYYRGRFTNGPNYADVLASGLGLSLAPSLAGGTNYAFGGARTDSHPSGQPFDLLSQVAGYTSRVSHADPNALYVVFAGANNLQDAISAAAADPGRAGVIGGAAIANAVGDIGDAIDSLVAKGARHFLVPNAPNLALVPRIAGLGSPALSAFAGFLSADFDSSLDAMLDLIIGVDIRRLDTYHYLQDIVSNPAAFGITNAKDRCYTGDDLTFKGGGTICSDPDGYLFWDGIHPTAAVHKILGTYALAAVVPEPGILVLFSVGLLGLGISRRQGARKRRSLAS